MLKAQRVASILVILSLLFSLGVLAPPAAGAVAADPAEIHVYSGESIQSAIDAAAPGDIVIVHPGTYAESLSIEKSLTLISSDGAAATIIDWCSPGQGTVLISLLDSETVVFGGVGTGFTVDGASRGIDFSAEYWSSLTIEGNTFTDCEYAIDVEAVRYFSDAIIRGNTINHTFYAGITFGSASLQYHSAVDVIDNTFIACGTLGVSGASIESASHVVVQGNTIDAWDGGVSFLGVFNRSTLDIIDNEIRNSHSSCISIQYLSELSEGRIQDNTVVDNPDSGYGIDVFEGLDDGGRLTIQGNAVNGNQGYGCNIYEVTNGSYLAVVDNEFNDNGEDGLYIESLFYGCECVVTDNTITGNGSDGVFIYGDLEDGGLLTVENNTITGNGDHGFYVCGVNYRSHVDLLDNDISGNEQGVYVNDITHLSECRIEGNTISNNGDGEHDDGVYVAYVNAGARLYVDDNDIKGNGGYGLELGSSVYDGSSISLTNNDISDNVGSGVYVYDVYDGSECLFQGNTVTGNGGSGVYVDSSNDEYGSSITVLDNTISGNDIYGLYVGSLSYGAYLGVLENTIEGNVDEGIYVSNLTNGSECVVTDNTIGGNGYGIYVDYASDGCLLDIEDNTVTGSLSGVGIYCGDYFLDSELRVLGNTISDNAGIGLKMCEDNGDLGSSLADSKATVRCNTISGNASWGISAYIYRALVDISGNHITGNGTSEGGIYVSGDLFQVVGIHRNSIAGNTDWGLQNGGSDVLDATENWWGNGSGPYHAAGNPSGLGDDVSNQVDYADWLSAAPGLCATCTPDVPEPATIMVDDSGGADYTSIQDAIDGSASGDIILVSAGTYSEDVSIDDSRTVKSTGGADATFIVGMVSLDVGHELSTIVFGGVDAGFTITAGSSEGVYIDSEDWSQVTLQGNIIKDCSGNGIVAGVQRFSTLSILDNEIRDNVEGVGIDLSRVWDFSSADIRRNIVTGHYSCGVNIYSYVSDAVMDHGTVSIVDNEITGNAHGVYFDDIANNSSVLMQDNTMSLNTEDGVEFYDVECSSTLDIIDNEIQDNDYTGIYGNGVPFKAEARISGNSITGSGDYGIYMYGGPSDGGQLTVEDNTITGTVNTGFIIDEYDVETGGYLALLDNEISGNGSYGVNVFGFYEGGEGLISGNTISGNGSDGLYVEDGVTYGAALTIEENTIEDNQGYGVYVDALESGSYLALLDNQLNTNDAYGMYLYDCYYSGALIEGNTFTENAGYGVCVGDDVYGGSWMTIKDNIFTDNTDNACEVAPANYGSHLDLLDNQATGGGAEGFDLSGYYEGSQGIISGNSISGAAGDGVYVQELDYGCILSVESNTFSQNGDIGFDCSSGTGFGSYLAVLNNRLEDNTSDGLYIYDIVYGSEAVIEGNIIAGNDEGITIEYMSSAGLLTVQNNEVSENDSIGLWLCGTEDTLADSETAVFGNYISGNNGWGIESNISHALVDISQCNKIEQNAGGIHILGSGFQLVHVNNNNVEGNAEWGLLNDGLEAMDATQNWWGDVSGPYHATGNPAGLGDTISDLVMFDPWLTQACAPSNIAAAFKASAYKGAPGITIDFTDQSTTACEVVQWLWDFGDGSASTEQNPSHTYQNVGEYTVTLTVWDACGYSDAVEKRACITVVRPPAPERSSGGRSAEPALLGLSYLVVDPVLVLPNQPVTVSVNVCNNGEERGTKTVSLMVNGEAVDSRTVGVPGGACQTVTFTVARVVPGTYQVAVDGMTGQFSVLAPRTVTSSVPSAPNTGLGTAGIVAIIVVMLVLIAALVVVFRR